MQVLFRLNNEGYAETASDMDDWEEPLRNWTCYGTRTRHNLYLKPVRMY